MISTFWLSKKKGSEAWVKPVVDDAAKTVRFDVHDGSPDNPGACENGSKLGRGPQFKCLVCGATPDGQYVKDEGTAGRMGQLPVALVTEGNRTRNYSTFTRDDLDLDLSVALSDDIRAPIPRNPRTNISAPYGLTTFSDLFTTRQMATLTSFSDLVVEARQLVNAHATETIDTATSDAYANAVATYLAFAVDRGADRWSSLATWQNSADKVRAVFARQGIPMIWDFAEANPFSGSTGNWRDAVEWIVKCLLTLPWVSEAGRAAQMDSTTQLPQFASAVISTDPPYYDNIVYADIADFFYVWLRRSLSGIYPREFSTLLTPKAPELVAAPYRFDGDRQQAERHFESGLGDSFQLMRGCSHDASPMTVFYAYKQTEQRGGENTGVTAGWETMLTSLIGAGFTITGTWPMRTERSGRSIAIGTNALATSVVLVCRPRPDDASMADIGEFNRALASELPVALRRFIGEHIAPVDLPQASIGPGMAVFSRYSAVVRPNGDHMTVREALELINAGVEQFFSEREGAFDGATQFCLRWFEQFGFEDGPFGDADTMARAKDISVEELQRDGLLTARRGRVQLIPFERYEATWESWEPSAERRLSAWRACHYLAAALEHGGVFGGQGDHDAGGAARLARELGGNGEQAKELAYRLYAICDAKGWASEARRYNALADAWSEISAEAGRLRQAQQGRLG